MITIDVVGNPSFGQDAIFNSRTESVSAKAKPLTESVSNVAPRPLVESIESVMGRYGRAIARGYGNLEECYGVYNKNALISALRQGV